MNIQNTLQIMLITYNRSYWLNRTLKQLFAENSPIKNCDITILDNNSTDDTIDIVKKYQMDFPNLKYQKNYFNIGGNGNICRAFELGAQSGKEYLWVLCDDDYYDWSNWSEVEKLMEQSIDCIGVARYAIPTDALLSNKAYQFFQLSFVPAGIHKISNFSDGVLTNMYDAILTMFQQDCIVANLINNKKKIVFLKNSVVENGLHVTDKNEPKIDCSFTRGQEKTEKLLQRRDKLWVFGFAQIVSLLNDKNLQKECLKISIPYKDIYGSFDNFLNCMQEFKTKEKMHWLLELLPVLPDELREKLEQDIFEIKIRGIEPDYNLSMIKKELSETKRLLSEINCYSISNIFKYLNYQRVRLFSHFTFGKIKKHYVYKKRKYKDK